MKGFTQGQRSSQRRSKMKTLYMFNRTFSLPTRTLVAMAFPTVFALLLLASPSTARAQTFDSGSNGSDGVLNFTTPGTVDFDPVALGLDADHDNVYQFTTINIAAGVTVRLSEVHLSGPVFWLASGSVQIDGIIDLSGQNGQNGQDILNDAFRLPSVAGAGGFGGGLGGSTDSALNPGLGGATAGNGPGGATPGGGAGSGAGYASSGAAGRCYYSNPCGAAGQPYGSAFLVPLVGGSGGAGGVRDDVASGYGGGGGAGGGAILIASSASIAVTGGILANGGGGGASIRFGGGGGSGGSIRLVAPTIGVSQTAVLTAVGGGGGSGFSAGFGNGNGGSGASGRIRLEAFQHSVTGSVNPSAPMVGPVAVFLPDTAAPSLRIVDINGAVLVNPMASLIMPDATTNTNAPVAVSIEAHNIPAGTTVQLQLVSENAPDQIFDSSPLAGTSALSTATVTVNQLPPGLSRGFLHAKWAQQQ